MKLKCKLCNYAWNYNGKHKFWATCPVCLRKVKVVAVTTTADKRPKSGGTRPRKSNSR